jgi:hypothetical protein
MGGTWRVMGAMQRIGPRAGDAAGLLFFMYWNVRARDLGLPAFVMVPLTVLTAVLLSAAIVGYQFAQGTAKASWIGWGAAAAVVMGSFMGSLTLTCAGLAVWGYSVVRCRVLPVVPGLLLTAGAAALFVIVFISPGFGRAHADLSTPWRLVMGVCLVVVAAAFADLDPRIREAPQSSGPPPTDHHGGGGDPWLDEALAPARRGTRG